MKKIRFFHTNLLGSITATSSSAAAAYPLTRLSHDWFTKYTRTTGVASEWWKWDMGAAKSFTGIIFKGHNFRAGSVVKIQANAADAWGSPSIDETITITADMVARELVYKFWEVAESYQWIRLYVEDVGNPAGYLKLGKPWAGIHFEPSANFNNPYIPSTNDLSVVSLSSDGYHFGTEVTPRLQSFEYEFEGLTNVDRLAFLAMYDVVGITKTFFILQDADDAVNKLFYVRNTTATWSFPHRLLDNDFSFKMPVMESR